MSLSNINKNFTDFPLPKEIANASVESDNAGLLLISCACNLYRKKFKSEAVPFSFIEFYIEEMSHYSDKLNGTIKHFFKDLKKEKNFELFIRMYTRSGYNVAKGIKSIDGYQYLILDNKNNFFIDDFIERPTTYTDKQTAEQLKNIYHEYIKSDELKNLNELYDDFLIEKFIENYNNVEHQKKPKEKTPAQKQSDILNTTYIGTKNDIPKQKGKVVQVNIPRFKLPMSYPIDSKNSRILSEYRAKKFAYADKCIKFVNRHQITAIGFSVGFVEKRKSAKKKDSFDKFGFDF